MMNILEQAPERLPLFSDVIISRDPSASRHQGNSTSADAHERTKSRKRANYLAILRLLKAAGGQGMTVKELALDMGLGDRINVISGRLSELKSLGLIRGIAVRRERCEVVVHHHYRQFVVWLGLVSEVN